MELQKQLIDLHSLVYKGDISTSEYQTKLDELQENNKDVIKKKLGRRLDRRTLGEWGVELLNNESVEQKIAKFWFPKYARKHFPGYESHECIGVDQSGIIYLDGSKTTEVDYILNTGDRVEIKDCPSLKKATYKVKNIKHYLKISAWVLTIHKKGGIPSFYTLISPEGLAKMVEEVGISNRWEMGHKPCYQFYFKKKENVSELAVPFGGYGKVYQC